MAGELRSTYKPTIVIAALFALVLLAVTCAVERRHRAVDMPAATAPAERIIVAPAS